ncbi:helix-turn-helix domain-containing protein [Microaceticoccus formicicus]|uniref:helix-turn-helix domain-containing protein n=1 Tax=Microaceticoccus formicicus TaxID=3118105 RepID=UPI003CD02026|nr:helix-turn-helix domain-containing protein [Peptoniphilaceae bacterium AMB_02]
MKDINIARVISENRKLKGITQDELANYIGVSKSSVSKWETAQSYPDITFLPQLASYFNISIDELMGYEPQMTKEDIRNLYLRLSNEFYEKPFEDIITYCQEVIKKYFSCYPLLYQIGVLLFNNSNLANNEKRMKEIIVEAKKLFIKIKNESDDIELVKQAFYMETLSLITLGYPDEVIKLLDESNSLVMSVEILLGKAYQMIGNTDKAKETLQIEIYQYMRTLLQLLHSYLSLFIDDEKQFDEISKRFLTIANIFNLDKLKPDALLPFYLTLAHGKIVNRNTDKALEYLENYTRIATGNIYPLKLKGDDFFTLIDKWFENFPIGTNPPRNEKVIKQSMYEAVVNNPNFSTFEDNTQYKNLVMKLRNNC